MSKQIAVITTVRNADAFLRRWIAHYGAAVGQASLFVFLDGWDQSVPEDAGDVNFLRGPFVPRNRVAGDKSRAARNSDLAAALFQSFDIVIATDVDELLVVDPKVDAPFAEYIAALAPRACYSGLGLDVTQHLDFEQPLDPARGVLEQRRFAKLSDRYTKACILTKPGRWGSGQHRVRGRNFHIDENLYLFHIGNADAGSAQDQSQDADRVAAGWSAHQERRTAVFEQIRTADPVDGDARFETARAQMRQGRKPWAWNKPAPLRAQDIITIPDRFRGCL